MVGVDKVSTQGEYYEALEGDVDLNENVVRLGESNELACKDLILNINANLAV